MHDHRNEERSRRPQEEGSQLKLLARPLPLLGGAIITLGGLAMLVIRLMSSDSHGRKLILAGTAVFVAFLFGFASLIVRSYRHDKQKEIEQHPYHHDRSIH